MSSFYNSQVFALNLYFEQNLKQQSSQWVTHRKSPTQKIHLYSFISIHKGTDVLTLNAATT